MIWNLSQTIKWYDEPHGIACFLQCVAQSWRFIFNGRSLNISKRKTKSVTQTLGEGNSQASFAIMSATLSTSCRICLKMQPSSLEMRPHDSQIMLVKSMRMNELFTFQKGGENWATIFTKEACKIKCAWSLSYNNDMHKSQTSHARTNRELVQFCSLKI